MELRTYAKRWASASMVPAIRRPYPENNDARKQAIKRVTSSS